MLNATDRELLVAIAEAAAALTGLLFVAMSVAPGRTARDRPPVVQQVRTAAALLSFSNALTVSLFGLVPGNNLGWPALIIGIIGVFFTAAAFRSILTSAQLRGRRVREYGLILLLAAVFGVEVACGIALLAHPGQVGSVELLENVLVGSLVIGVARAWELVGDRETGILASISVLAGRNDPAHPGAGAGRSPAPVEPDPARPDGSAGGP